MMLYIKTLLAYITLHPHLAYGAIFLVSLSESLALVGLIVPGTVIMFGVGAIVASGSLDLKLVLMLAVAGAVAGDGISYWLGHHYHQELRGRWPFSRYPGMLKNGETFFHRHGGKSILFGRFVGPVRPVIPVVAGMLGMSPLQFSIVNVLSAVGWALVYILPGVFFGTSLAVAGAVSTRLAVLVAIFLVALWGFVAVSRRLVMLIGRRGPFWLAGLKDWAASDIHAHRMMLPVKRFVSYLFFNGQGEELFLLFLVLVLFVAGWGSLSVLQDVLAKDPLVVADQAVYHFFQSLRTPWADHILVTVTELGDSFVNICLAGAILLAFLVKRCYRTAGYWVITILGGLLGVQLLKWLIHSPRPLALYHGASAFGFPSGHTTMSVIIYGFLAILLARNLSSSLRWGLVVTVLVLSFFIALSRLYLGAHWLSDVLGGFLIGTSWTALLGITYTKRVSEIVPRRFLGLIAILVVVIAGSWNVGQRHEKDLTLYAPQKNIQTIPLKTWMAEGWRDLPAWRIDMEGEYEQPLTIQLAGSPKKLTGYLLTKGWRHPSPLNLRNFLGMLSPDTKLEDLPVLPKFHDGRSDSLLLIREVNNQRWILRMWPTDMEISANNTPLFVGTVEVQDRRHTAKLITLARDTGQYEPALAALQEILTNRFAVKMARQTYKEVDIDHEYRRVKRSGSVLLVSENNI